MKSRLSFVTRTVLLHVKRRLRGKNTNKSTVQGEEMELYGESSLLFILQINISKISFILVYIGQLCESVSQSVVCEGYDAVTTKAYYIDGTVIISVNFERNESSLYVDRFLYLCLFHYIQVEVGYYYLFLSIFFGSVSGHGKASSVQYCQSCIGTISLLGMPNDIHLSLVVQYIWACVNGRRHAPHMYLFFFKKYFVAYLPYGMFS